MTDHEDRCNWDASSDGKAECLDHGVMFELRPEVPVFASGSAYFVGPAAAPRNRVTDQATRTDADALRDTRNHAQGTVVHAADADHAREMRRRGLIGPRGGLTRRGSIRAEQLRNAALDDAFGPL